MVYPGPGRLPPLLPHAGPEGPGVPPAVRQVRARLLAPLPEEPVLRHRGPAAAQPALQLLRPPDRVLLRIHAAPLRLRLRADGAPGAPPGRVQRRLGPAHREHHPDADVLAARLPGARPGGPEAGDRRRGLPDPLLGGLQDREFTKGGFVIDAFPLCNCNTLGSVVNVQIENMPNC